jgi:WD40 repeat protein
MILGISEHTGPVKSCSVYGKLLATTSLDGTILIIDHSSADIVQKISIPGDGAFNACWAPQGNYFVSCSLKKSLLFFDPRNKWKTVEFNWENGRVDTLDWHPDGTHLAVGCEDGKVFAVDVNSSEIVREISAHKSNVSCVRWNDAGTHIASTSFDSTVKIWDFNSGVKISELEGHKNRVNHCCYVTGNEFLASASSDIKIWNPLNQELLLTLDEHTDQINSCEWSPDPLLMASCSDDNTVKIWKFPDAVDEEDDDIQADEENSDHESNPNEKRNECNLS